MRRRSISVLGGATVAALLATTTTAIPAGAAPAADGANGSPGAAEAAAAAKKDNRPDALATARAAERDKAIRKVLAGKAEVEQHNGSRAVEVKPGNWVEYGVQRSDQLLSFLVEFGDQRDARAEDDPTMDNGSGPRAGQIPEPDRSTDNSTYWTPTFDRKHYLDMFFNGMPEQAGESFKSVRCRSTRRATARPRARPT